MRDILNVIIQGKTGVGKTQIAHHILEKPFEPNYIPTHFTDFSVITKGNVHMNMYDMDSNDDDTQLYTKPTHILYCIDFSEEVNKDKVRDDTAALKLLYQDIKIILVATRSDQYSGTDLELKLKAIDIEADERIITSAKHNIGLTKISTLLFGTNQISKASLPLWDVVLPNTY